MHKMSDVGVALFRDGVWVGGGGELNVGRWEGPFGLLVG